MSNNSIDLQSILNSAKSQLSSLEGLGSSNGTTSSNNYVNSVWGLVQNGQTAIDGNDSQKAESIVKIVKNLLSTFSSIGANENAQATKDVKANDDKATELSNDAENTTKSTEEQVNDLIAQISDGRKTVSDAISKLEELGGDKGQLAEVQQKLDEQIAIIEQNKQILNDDSANAETKKAALANLQTAAGAIDELVANVSSIQEAIQEQNTTVEEATNNIAGFIEQSASVISNGVETLQKYIQQGAAQTVTNTATATEGAAVNIPTGTTAESMGTVGTITGFGAGAGAKLLKIGADQIAAGGTRIAGSTKTLASLTTSLGKMGADIQNIANFTDSVGRVAEGVISLVGDYESKTESLITATGSWIEVANVNDEFKTAITDYQSNNGLENADKTEKTSSTQDNSSNKFEFDPQKFKAAFGI